MDSRKRFAVAGLVVLVVSVVAMRLNPDRGDAGPVPYTQSEQIVIGRTERPLADTLTGTVRDRDGNPIRGARVRWIGWKGDAIGELDSRTSDADGGFSFSGARERSERGVALVAQHPGFGLGIATRRDLGDGSAVRITCGPPATMRIPFVTQDRAPVPGIPVTVSVRVPTLGWFPLHVGETPLRLDASGVLQIGNLPYGGFVQVGVTSDRYSEPILLNNVAVGREPLRELRPVVLYPTGKVEGRVVSPNGAPIGDLRIVATAIVQSQVGGSFTDMPGREVRTRTSKDGRFELLGLSPRTYRIAVDAAHEQAASGWTAVYRDVEVRAGRTVSMDDLVPTRGVIVSGRCRDVVTGEPVPGVTIHFYSPNQPTATPEPITSSSVLRGRIGPNGFPLPRPVPSVNSRPDGTFALCAPPGAWKLFPVKFERASIPTGDFLPDSPQMVLKLGDRKVIDFRFRRHAETVSRFGGLSARTVKPR